MNTLSSPLVFRENEIYYDGVCRDGSKCCVSKDYSFTKNSEISDQTISEKDFPVDWKSRHPFFQNTECGDLTITKCNFINCKEEEDYGGGISISAYLEVILHHCIFDQCQSVKHGCGGAIGATFGFKDDLAPTPTFTDAKKLDVQYTCFSNCFPTTNDKAFGTALLMAAEEVILYYASTTDCPKDKTAYGAQFDIQAQNSILSQYVNATGGKSKYCGAIEYRNSKSGFFRYQTLMKMECKYVTSFTSVDINDIQIFSCNVNNNTVSFPAGGGDNYNKPALVFVRFKKLTVTNFFFFYNTFKDDALFAEKEHNNDKENININLVNCYADVGDKKLWEKDYIITTNCEFKSPMEKTLVLKQLNLGKCQGDIEPGPIVDNPYITESIPFSSSSGFTSSGKFTSTNFFSKSNDFTGSKDFLNQ